MVWQPTSRTDRDFKPCLKLILCQKSNERRPILPSSLRTLSKNLNDKRHILPCRLTNLVHL